MNTVVQKDAKAKSSDITFKNVSVNSLNNGTYIKGKFCGVHAQERTRTQNGVQTQFMQYYLILETSLTSQKQWIRLSNNHIQSGLHETYRNPDYLEKTVLLPVFYTVPRAYNGNAYQDVFLGNDMPVFCND